MGAAPFAGAVEGVPRLLLRLEGAALFIGAALFYWRFDGSWRLFAVLFLAPDLSFLAYLISPCAGAIACNAFHTTLGPFALLALAAWLAWPSGEDIALIWLAHVGVDRAFGYGLKYATAFGATHPGRIGKQT